MRASAGAVALVLAATSAIAADAVTGKALYEKACTGCHGAEVFTRPERRVDSLPALREQVEACSVAAGTGWSEAQKADVVEFLNREFYRFPQ